MRHIRWFKLWHEARTDRKLDTLHDDEHRVWFNLLCYASEQDERGTIAEHDLLAVECARADDDLLERTLAKLVRLRMVTRADGLITFTSFNRRQYDKPSDEPAAVRERVTRHRNAPLKEGNAAVTPMQRAVTPCNAIEERRVEESREEKSTGVGVPQAETPPPTKAKRYKLTEDWRPEPEHERQLIADYGQPVYERERRKFIRYFLHIKPKLGTPVQWRATLDNWFEKVQPEAALALSNGHRSTGPPQNQKQRAQANRSKMFGDSI